ncbi:MAG: heterodisulfide reductase subunit F [Deltaproteobacteria bacterium RIFCSPLOWO2_12_FULL_43_16]|nr:MAG: heterodisulfide reductase subunit F [Deltaproteobacteria bacterium GWA2_43_19]OGQ59857.1 MAG: heterodisulfide reductase subunit F [Deltaproteobacteria bacterium RIFCSPLOWO2_12_FULL_43_16]HBR18133.1 heterodisulfide reductase subunit F [Deltaproteobacteria bacterium]
MDNIYLPYLATIEDIYEEAPDVRTFKLVFKDEKVRETFSFKTGQFGLYSVFGAGESTFCIASSPTHRGYIQCTFRKSGRVTGGLSDLGIGDTMGFRGPYGNWFPIDEWKGKNLVFIAGGIGLPPVRSVIWNCLDRRKDFGDITIVYGAKSVADLVYKNELSHWSEMSDIKLVQTVDPGGETPDWKGKIGFVPTVLEQATPSPKDAIAITCGPPIMIKFVLQALNKLGFSDEQVYTTLENKMKCGVGKCGRCNVGDIYICKEGPVYTAAEVKRMYNDF